MRRQLAVALIALLMLGASPAAGARAPGAAASAVNSMTDSPTTATVGSVSVDAAVGRVGAAFEGVDHTATSLPIALSATGNEEHGLGSGAATAGGTNGGAPDALDFSGQTSAGASVAVTLEDLLGPLGGTPVPLVGSIGEVDMTFTVHDAAATYAFGFDGTITLATTPDGASSGSQFFRLQRQGGVGGLISETDGNLGGSPLERSGLVLSFLDSGTLLPGTYRLQFNIGCQVEAQIGSADCSGSNSLSLALVFGPAAAALSIGDVSQPEGDAGESAQRFTVSLSPSATVPVTVAYRTVHVTTDDTDLNADAGTLSFAPGELTKIVAVTVSGDTEVEDDETFHVVLADPTGATIADGLGAGTITNDDEPLVVDFDWTMPDRFGFDRNGDGLIDYYLPTGTLPVEPGRWQVDLRQTLPVHCDTSHSRFWFVDGQPILPGDPGIIAYDPNTCTLSYGFADEGVFHVELRIEDTTGVQVAAVAREVTVQDWLIVSIGDSVASGEGVPDLNENQTGSDADWQSQRCHRSAHAGPAEAARNLENLDPRTSVTFIHLACSGADILKGLLRPYAGIAPGPGGAIELPQVTRIGTLIAGREIDALLLSIGANDIGFSDIVWSCVKWKDCHLHSGKKQFDKAIIDLPGRFDQLEAVLSGPSGPPGLPAARVYATEYFDPTRADDTGVCGRPNTREVLYDIPLPSALFGISAAEAEWASNTMLVRLNREVAAAAVRHGWNYIGGIRDLFLRFDLAGHGYCATDSWIVRYQQSLADQGDEYGTLHPNLLGHAVYAGMIFQEIRDDFYTNGDLTRPRPPAP